MKNDKERLYLYMFVGEKSFEKFMSDKNIRTDKAAMIKIPDDTKKLDEKCLIAVFDVIRKKKGCEYIAKI